MPPGLILLLVFAAFAAASLWLALRVYRRSRHRQLAIGRVLDAADALEERLRAARSELETVAADADNPVLGAMQELLRQRLWLQQYAQSASLESLQQMRESLDAARSRIDTQLRRVDRARAEASP
ncbi:hypothetical protein LJB71_11705 [Thermomonas sp. S9]|uniref:hypothetical protein n=1 Tax=Thermomonas sp. S9 TaxID=2885203 RepID=UPI00216B33AC|nr:hypothetical protein [Thermomonas sp. S9]MCR6496811.1 hypothetical protein [Thermomonas sp. S9]